MLFALGDPQDATLDAVAARLVPAKSPAASLPNPSPAAVAKLRKEWRARLSWSAQPVVGPKHTLLLDGQQELSHDVWAAALKQGLDARGGQLPAATAS